MKFLFLSPSRKRRGRIFLEDGTELQNLSKIMAEFEPTCMDFTSIKDGMSRMSRSEPRLIALTLTFSPIEVELLKKAPKRKGAKA